MAPHTQQPGKPLAKADPPMRSAELIVMYSNRLRIGRKPEQALQVLYNVGTEMRPFLENKTEEAMEMYAKDEKLRPLVLKLREKFEHLRRKELEKMPKPIFIQKTAKRPIPLRYVDRTKRTAPEEPSAPWPAPYDDCGTTVTPLRSQVLGIKSATLHAKSLSLADRMQQFK